MTHDQLRKSVEYYLREADLHRHDDPSYAIGLLLDGVGDLLRMIPESHTETQSDENR